MSLLCYNKSCGQRFDPANSTDDACTFHPGVPVFHDALKGWSCCKRRTTDFSDFLSIEGCSRGPHIGEKPSEPVRPDVKTSEQRRDIGNDLKPRGDPYIIQAPKPLELINRPCGDEPLVRLQQKVSTSLRQALEKLQLTVNNQSDNAEEEGSEVKVGTSCKNGGCPQSYHGPDSYGQCKHHPGQPIFHEGMKYWSCCKKKTSDFNSFLSQPGCSTGSHVWRKPQQGRKVVPCRIDWHQTGNQLIISIYAKNPTPELSFVEANSTTVIIRAVFEGEKEFEQKIELWGAVEVDSSVVTLMAAKMEVAMKKAEPVTWARLDLPITPEPPL